MTFYAGARIEEFLYEKLDRKAPSRITNGELLGQYMEDAAKEFGPGTPYGESHSLCGLCFKLEKQLKKKQTAGTQSGLARCHAELTEFTVLT